MFNPRVGNGTGLCNGEDEEYEVVVVVVGGGGADDDDDTVADVDGRCKISLLETNDGNFKDGNLATN